MILMKVGECAQHLLRELPGQGCISAAAWKMETVRAQPYQRDSGEEDGNRDGANEPADQRASGEEVGNRDGRRKRASGPVNEQSKADKQETRVHLGDMLRES